MGLAFGGAAVYGDLIEPALLAGYHLDCVICFEGVP